MQAELVVIANAAEQRALARYLRQVDRQYCSSTLLSVCLFVCLFVSLIVFVLTLANLLSVCNTSVIAATAAIFTRFS